MKQKIAYLKKKCGTNNPFEIASQLNMKILYEELGSINGYYNQHMRMKQIHINYNLSEHNQSFTCAHELGHAVLHPKANTSFLRSKTYLLVDRMEIEANKFAVELLITDEELHEYRGYTVEQLSRIFNYHEKLIELRLK